MRLSWTVGLTTAQENLLATVFQGPGAGTIVLTDTVYATVNP
ncbi:MAG TPA: hypothetical protein VFA43_13060 [Gemmatimonadaceae bacterium]|nr:hypothetical protein [Gemmatimonadaceae bacterium]